MNKTLAALKKGVKAGVKAAREFSQPKKYKAVGKNVICSHCSNNTFTEFTWWADGIGYGLECSQCTRIEYFARKAEEN